MNIDKDKLFGNFVNIKKIANFHILKCYRQLFSIKGIKKNIGAFIIIPIIIFHIICIVLFYKKNLSLIQDKIKDIIFGIKNWKLVKQVKREKKLKIKKEKKRVKKEKEKKLKKSKNSKKIKQKKELGNLKEIGLGDNYVNKIPGPLFNLITNNFNQNDDKLNPPKKGRKKNKIIVINNYLNIVNNNNKNEINDKSIAPNNSNETSQKEIVVQKIKEIMEYNELELNLLTYELALKYDKRTFCNYYISIIKTKHNLINSFFYSNDYNSKIMKIDLFIINFVIYLTVNAFFFDDDTMHKIYVDKGSFNFIYQLPQILYSSIISAVLNSLLKLLALSEDYILNLKKNKDNKNIDQRNAELNKKLKIIFLFFFIISSIFLLFFWYYISMFCTIYKDTQIHLIKDTLISFGLSLLYPFGIYLLPGFFRIPALSDKRNKKEYLFNISKLLQMI